jgi:hypothetical protein
MGVICVSSESDERATYRDLALLLLGGSGLVAVGFVLAIRVHELLGMAVAVGGGSLIRMGVAGLWSTTEAARREPSPLRQAIWTGLGALACFLLGVAAAARNQVVDPEGTGSGDIYMWVLFLSWIAAFVLLTWFLHHLWRLHDLRSRRRRFYGSSTAQ